MKKIKKLFKSESGFTLIELLVVIGIIAILATIGAVNFASARGKARDAKRISDLKQIQASIEVAAAGTTTGLFPIDAPTEIQGLRPPRDTDAYCYYYNASVLTANNAGFPTFALDDPARTDYVVAALAVENLDTASDPGSMNSEVDLNTANGDWTLDDSATSTWDATATCPVPAAVATLLNCDDDAAGTPVNIYCLFGKAGAL